MPPKTLVSEFSAKAFKRVLSELPNLANDTSSFNVRCILLRSALRRVLLEYSGERELDHLDSSSIAELHLGLSLTVPDLDQYDYLERDISKLLAPMFRGAPLLDTVETLGMLYESWLESSNNLSRKRSGAFYTPTKIVDLITTRTIDNWVKCNNRIPTILDPSLGAGAFLIDSAKKLKDLGFGFDEAAATLFGTDIDSLSVDLSRACLAIVLSTLFNEPLCKAAPYCKENIICCDFMDSDHVFGQGESDTLKFDSSHKQFDCILGNPPYGISRDQQISTAQLMRIKTRYSKYLSGKPNKFLIFMARSAELLGGKGELSFIVPNSWLGIPSAKKLRTSWINNRFLTEVISFGTSAFPKLGLETIIFKAQKNHAREGLAIYDAKLSEKSMLGNQRLLPYKEISSTPDSIISLSYTTEHRSLLDQIETISIPLGSAQSGFIPRIALQAYAIGQGNPPQDAACVKQRIYDCTNGDEPNAVPYLEGRDVKRFSISWSGTYLRYGPWLAEPQKLEYFKTPRILIREIIAKAPHIISASFTDQPYLYNKSILHILIHEMGDPVLAKALTVVLNSKLAACWFVLRGRKTQRRRFPKLLVSDLKQFPIAKSFYEALPQIEKVHSKLELSSSNCCNKEIDDIVYSLYSLKNSHIQQIEDLLCGVPAKRL